MEDNKRIPVYLLTGFLGSGKTTLLNNLLTQAEMERTLIVINEFGEVGLDHLLVSHSCEGLVVELDNGCVCCTTLGDFANTMRSIPGRHTQNGKIAFDRVIVETTGLADPSPVIHTLMTDRSIHQQYRLQGVVTCIDAINGSETLDRHPESQKQAGVADLLLITKTDLIKNHNQLADFQKKITRINPSAEIVIAKLGSIAANSILTLDHIEPTQSSQSLNQWLDIRAFPLQQSAPRRFSLGQATGAVPSNNANRHSEHISAHCFTFDNPIHAGKVEVWMQIVTNLMGENLLRLKAILHLENAKGPMVIHGVQHIFHPPAFLDEWPDEDRRSKIVFITYDIAREELENIFALCF